MRVVLLVTDHERGGTPLRLARLARGLNDAGATVISGCLAPPGPVSAGLEDAGLATFACGARSIRDFGAVRTLRQHLHAAQPDLVHATLFHANVAARWALRGSSIPLLTSTATIEVERRWHAWVERATRTWDAGHVVNSASLSDHVHRAFGRDPSEIYIVPPSINPPHALPREDARFRFDLPTDAFVLGWAGRLDPVKRVDWLLQVLEQSRALNAHLLIAGDGPRRAPLQERAEQLGVAARVRWLGWQADLAPLWGAADAFVFPSRTEGAPNAVLEALAAGVPTITGDLPIFRQWQGDPPRLIIARTDTPAGFAQAVGRLAKDGAGRRELGLRAAAWAREAFNPTATARSLLAIYERIIAAATRRASPGHTASWR